MAVESLKRTVAPHSAVARLLLGAMLLQALAVALCLWALWPTSKVWAIAGAIAIVLAYAVGLAVQMTLLRRANQSDPAPAPSARALLRAWWAETRLAALVFYWRQPFFWRCWPDGGAPGQRGVVLVHGFACNRGVWWPWLKALRAENRFFVALNLAPVFGSIDAYAPLIDDVVRQAHAATGLAPVLVCHSMGGLAARAWLRAYADQQAALRVRHIVTLATPHHGTWAAQFSLATSGQQMAPNSDWLRQLAQGEPPAQAALFTCWYSNCDNVVLPASSATLPGARNRHLAGQAHLELALCEAVMQSTLSSLQRDDWTAGG